MAGVFPVEHLPSRARPRRGRSGAHITQSLSREEAFMNRLIEAEKTLIAAGPGSESPKNPVDNDTRRKKGRRKRALILGAIVLAVPLAIFGIRYFIWSLGHQATDDAYLTGHLHPISARVAGTVQEVLVDDNQHVSRDQTLVILDPKDFQVRLDQAKAALEEASRHRKA